jgi:hypothetical protein
VGVTRRGLRGVATFNDASGVGHGDALTLYDEAIEFAEKWYTSDAV